MTDTTTTLDPTFIHVDSVEHRYNNTKYGGSCGAGVTVEDIKARYYHPYTGGRDAWVKDGRWGAVEHGTD